MKPIVVYCASCGFTGTLVSLDDDKPLTEDERRGVLDFGCPTCWEALDVLPDEIPGPG